MITGHARMKFKAQLRKNSLLGQLGHVGEIIHRTARRRKNKK